MRPVLLLLATALSLSLFAAPPAEALHYCTDWDDGGHLGNAVATCSWACEGNRHPFVDVGSDDTSANVQGQAYCYNGPAEAFCASNTNTCSDLSDETTTPNTAGRGDCAGLTDEWYADFFWIYCDAEATGFAASSGSSARIEVRHGIAAGEICNYDSNGSECVLVPVYCAPVVGFEPDRVLCAI